MKKNEFKLTILNKSDIDKNIIFLKSKDRFSLNVYNPPISLAVTNGQLYLFTTTELNSPTYPELFILSVNGLFSTIRCEYKNELQLVKITINNKKCQKYYHTIFDAINYYNKASKDNLDIIGRSIFGEDFNFKKYNSECLESIKISKQTAENDTDFVQDKTLFKKIKKYSKPLSKKSKIIIGVFLSIFFLLFFIILCCSNQIASFYTDNYSDFTISRTGNSVEEIKMSNQIEKNIKNNVSLKDRDFYVKVLNTDYSKDTFSQDNEQQYYIYIILDSYKDVSLMNKAISQNKDITAEIRYYKCVDSATYNKCVSELKHNGFLPENKIDYVSLPYSLKEGEITCLCAVEPDM